MKIFSEPSGLLFAIIEISNLIKNASILLQISEYQVKIIFDTTTQVNE